MVPIRFLEAGSFSPSLTANDINLAVKVTAQDGARSGWSTASAFWFDSVAPDRDLSDAELGVDECFGAGSSIDVNTGEAGGTVWVRVYDREAGDSACDPTDATSCEAN